MGKRLKQNVDAVQANILKLYNKLANMAFWDAADQAAAEPTELDWSVPKVTVTITNSMTGGTNAVIKRGGNVVSGSVLVDVGSPLTLTLEAANGYELSNDIDVEVDGVSTQMTETDGVYTLEISQVNAAMTIEFLGTVVRGWTTIPKSIMVYGRSNYNTDGKSCGNSVKTICAPTWPNEGNDPPDHNDYPIPRNADYFIPVGDTASSITFKFHGETGESFKATIVAVDGSFAFIERKTYQDSINNEITFSLTATTRYVRVIMIKLVNGSQQDATTYWDTLPDDYVKYKVTDTQ